MHTLSITFPENLKKELDREAKREHTKRSSLIQKAVRVYLELKRRKSTMELLREGYEEMAGEAKRFLKEFDVVDRESLTHVD